MNWIRAARSSVIAVSTAQLTSGPATRMPWFRSSTARPPPRARATPLPSCGVVTSPAVPSTDENCKRNPLSRPADPPPAGSASGAVSDLA